MMANIRPIHPVVIAVDLRLKNDDVVAVCIRYANNSWGIRSLEDDWFETIPGPVKLEELTEKYVEMRKVKRAVKRATRISRKK